MYNKVIQVKEIRDIPIERFYDHPCCLHSYNKEENLAKYILSGLVLREGIDIEEIEVDHIDLYMNLYIFRIEIKCEENELKTDVFLYDLLTYDTIRYLSVSKGMVGEGQKNESWFYVDIEQ